MSDTESLEMWGSDDEVTPLWVVGEDPVKVPDSRDPVDENDDDSSSEEWFCTKDAWVVEPKLFPRTMLRNKSTRVWSQVSHRYRRHNCLGPPAGYVGRCNASSPESSFCDELLGSSVRYLVQRTNRNMRFNRSGNKIMKPVTLGEMYAFLGVHILMGFNRQPEISSYFSREEEVGCVAVQRVFSRQRFQDISSNLGYSQQPSFHTRPLNRVQTRRRSYQEAREKEDPITKVRSFLSFINGRFRAVRNVQRELCVDETMTAFKGRSIIKVRMPSKPVPCGFEHFTLTEAKSGYVLNDEAHIGKRAKLVFLKEEVPRPVFDGNFMGKVTLYLARHYLGVGCHLVFDNRFTSARLLQHLYLYHRTTAVGSLRGRSAEMPPDYGTMYKAKVKAGERGRHTVRQNGRLVMTAWKDTSTLCVLSTGIDPTKSGEMVSRRVGPKRVLLPCPSQVVDYQSNYKGVDLANQLATSYRIGRRSVRWHRYFFYHKLNQVLVNAYINWQEVRHGRKPTYLSVPRSQLRFRQAVTRQFIERCAERTNYTPVVQPVHGRIHELERSAYRRRCAICKARKVRHETNKRCKLCLIYLCNPGKRPECLKTHINRMCR